MTALASASSNCKLHEGYESRCSVKKMLAVSLKGLGAKTKWQAVNRQS
jgi:hypothetical protein